MPRRTRQTRKKAPVPPSDSSRRKLAAIAEDTEDENIESLLKDFDIQTVTFKKQARKSFVMEAKKLHLVLLEKSALPKEVLSMTLDEFQRRGGTFPAVMESLKLEKAGNVQATTTLQSAALKEPFKELRVQNKENVPTGQGNLAGQGFKTPAVTDRSKTVTKLDFTGNITKRKPKPFEHVGVKTWSTISGSPVDEHTFIQLHMEHCLDSMKTQIMEDTVMPQKWRTHILRSLRTIKTATMRSEDDFVTPMVPR